MEGSVSKIRVALAPRHIAPISGFLASEIAGTEVRK
jgi:hypothetical protein